MIPQPLRFFLVLAFLSVVVRAVELRQLTSETFGDSTAKGVW
jgi:hypothetical protein